jgi:hypothetical protein
LSDVDFLAVELIKGLLYLDLSNNQLDDFKLPTQTHFMPLLIVLRLSGNRLTVGLRSFGINTGPRIFLEFFDPGSNPPTFFPKTLCINTSQKALSLP